MDRLGRAYLTGELVLKWADLLRDCARRGPVLAVGDGAFGFWGALPKSAQTRWRAVNAPHLVALIRAGATFINGKLVERPDDQASPTAA